MDKHNVKHSVKNICMVLIVPIATYAIMEVISVLFQGTHVISSIMEVSNLAKNTAQLTLVALALSLNMSTGRMDFSLGGQQMIGCIIGGNLAVRLGLGPGGIILFVVLFGALAGLLVGVLFVTFRIPSMILGIGMALIYECICFSFSVDGFQLFGKVAQDALNNVWTQVVVAASVVVIFVILYGHTSFGYHYKAIRGSQRTAKSMGVNVILNCLVCYTLAGAAMSLAGLFSTAYTGVMSSTMGLSSATVAFAALLPVFVSGFIGRYTSLPIALFIGALSSKIISVALIQLGLPDPAITVINYLVIMAFLLLSNFSQRYAKNKAVKVRITEATLALKNT